MQPATRHTVISAHHRGVTHTRAQQAGGPLNAITQTIVWTCINEPPSYWKTESVFCGKAGLQNPSSLMHQTIVPLPMAAATA